MVILLIECPVRRPWVLVDVSCSTREASYINLASDYFERMNMQKYCNISNKWKKLILRGPSSWAMFEWRPYNYYVKIYFLSNITGKMTCSSENAKFTGVPNVSYFHVCSWISQPFYTNVCGLWQLGPYPLTLNICIPHNIRPTFPNLHLYSAVQSNGLMVNHLLVILMKILWSFKKTSAFAH